MKLICFRQVIYKRSDISEIHDLYPIAWFKKLIIFVAIAKKYINCLITKNF